MTPHVLITGGAGFIGTHTAGALVARGYRVRALDSLDAATHGHNAARPPNLPPEVELVIGDVRDRATVAGALADVDAVVHLAGCTGVTESMFEVRRYVDTNVTGTATLLEAIVERRSAVRRLVVGSSRAIYGEGACYCSACDRVEHPPRRTRARLERGEWDLVCGRCGGAMQPTPTTESAPSAPVSVYAQTKLWQEELCRMLAETYGLSIAVLRYFNVYGTNQSPSNPYTGIVPAFCSRIASGRPVPIYEDGAIVRDFVHVSDVVAANVAAVEAEAIDVPAINVGSGVELTVLDLGRAVCEAMGAEARIEMTGQFRDGDVRSCVADISVARRVLGYEPRVALPDGLREYARWFLDTNTAVGDHDGADRELARRSLLHRTTSARPDAER